MPSRAIWRTGPSRSRFAPFPSRYRRPTSRRTCGPPKSTGTRYITRTKDGRQFSDARLFFNQGFSCIDAVMRVDEKKQRWVMVVKNSRDFDLKQRPGRNLWLTFTGFDLDHPQFPPALGPIVGTHSTIFSNPDPKKSMAEGPSLLRFQDQWRLYWDEPAGNGLQLAASPDLATWTHIKAAKFPSGAHHGTAFLAPKAAVSWLALPADSKHGS